MPNKKIWSEVKVLNLIEEVRERPSLWNPEREAFKKRNKSSEWSIIAKNTKLSVVLVENKWKTLLRQYKTDKLKVNNSKSGDGAEDVFKPKKASIYNALDSFLSSTATPNESSSNLKSLVQTDDSDSAIEDLEPTMSPPKKGISQSNDKEREKYMKFFSSMIDHVLLIPDPRKLQFFSEFQKLLGKFAYEDTSSEDLQKKPEDLQKPEDFIDVQSAVTVASIDIPSCNSTSKVKSDINDSIADQELIKIVQSKSDIKNEIKRDIMESLAMEARAAASSTNKFNYSFDLYSQVKQEIIEEMAQGSIIVPSAAASSTSTLGVPQDTSSAVSSATKMSNRRTKSRSQGTCEAEQCNKTDEFESDVEFVSETRSRYTMKYSKEMKKEIKQEVLDSVTAKAQKVMKEIADEASSSGSTNSSSASTKSSKSKSTGCDEIGQRNVDDKSSNNTDELDSDIEFVCMTPSTYDMQYSNEMKKEIKQEVLDSVTSKAQKVIKEKTDQASSSGSSNSSTASTKSRKSRSLGSGESDRHNPYAKNYRTSRRNLQNTEQEKENESAKK